MLYVPVPSNSFLISVLFFAFVLQSGFAQSPDGYQRGDQIIVPANVGMDNQRLGMGYPFDLSRLDETRVIDNEVRVVQESSYRALFRKQTDTFQLTASANALNILNASTSQRQTKRHAVLTVYNVSEVAHLTASPAQAKGSNADLFVSKIYYGWALNVVIEGEARSFTTGVATVLQDMVGAGGNLRSLVQKHDLRTEVTLRGLQSKSPTPPIALTWQEVQEQFEIGDPQPILVEYTFLRDIQPEPIEWKDRTLSPGRYRISQIHATVSRSKADGRNWDMMSGPDAVVEIYQDGRSLVNAGPTRNRNRVTYRPNRVISLREGTVLQFNVYDEDSSRSASDPIGEAAVRYQDLRQRAPGEAIDLPTRGQLSNFQIVLTPVE